MIRTFKVKHNFDLSQELKKAWNVANFALKHKIKSLTEVKYFGLKSAIANQIVRKISRNKKIKSIKHVNLIIPNQSIKVEGNTVKIACLKLTLNLFVKGFSKISQIELNNQYAYISCTFPEPEVYKTSNYIGVDLNSTGHMAVVANPHTGKVWKLNKKSNFIHSKYRKIRKRLTRLKQFKTIKKIRDRESRICKDLDNKTSSTIIKIAKNNKCSIRMENLKNIRKNSKTRSKTQRASLNNWSFYRLKRMIEYKAKLHGVYIEFIDPRYTSQADSRTGHLGCRFGKTFKTTNGVVEHADVNAAFNIALNQLNIAQLREERVSRKRHKIKQSLTDLPQEATSNKSLRTSKFNALQLH